MAVFSKKNLEKIRAEEKQPKKHAILLVDDEKDNLVTLTNVLSDFYDVHTAADGQEALDLVKKQELKIHLIISDQRMPQLTGVEFLQESLDIIPHTKRIILSGFADVEAILAAINKARIHEFLLKPVENQKLLLTVKRALEAYELERNNVKLIGELKELNANLETKVEDRTSELREAMRKLEILATTDQLTGAFNRRKCEEILVHEVERFNRYDRTFSIVIFDIDHFKKVNDVYGHLVGDIVLKEIAGLIREKSRANDYLVRWGGEEFLILLPEIELSSAKTMAENIRVSIATHRFPEVEKITVSLGVTEFRSGDTTDRLLVRADEALYRAKNGGRNKVVEA